MLTTGVDAPTCKNIVLVRVIKSMTEFKQIIGRGTRVRDDYGKLYFNILDYTGSATRLFADPDFDGEPVTTTVVQRRRRRRDNPGDRAGHRSHGYGRRGHRGVLRVDGRGRSDEDLLDDDE